MWKNSVALLKFRARSEEQVLPAGHAALFGWHQSAAAEEERRFHDVEVETVFAREREAADDVWRFHEAETQGYDLNIVADGFDADAGRRRCGADGEQGDARVCWAVARKAWAR